MVTARIAGFSPGTSPPPVRIPITPFLVATWAILHLTLRDFQQVQIGPKPASGQQRCQSSQPATYRLVDTNLEARLFRQGYRAIRSLEDSDLIRRRMSAKSHHSRSDVIAAERSERDEQHRT